MSSIPPVGNQVQGSNGSGFFNSIFTKETFTLLMWALAIYIIIYFGSTVFSKRDVVTESSDQMLYSQSVDIVLFGLLIIFIISGYYSLNQNDRSNLLGWFIRWTREFFDNPNSIIEAGIFFLVFFAVVYLFRIPMTPEAKPIFIHIIEAKIWIVFATLFVVMFFKYVLGIPIMDILFGNQFMQTLQNLPSRRPSPGSNSPGGGIGGFFDRITQNLKNDFGISNTPSPTTKAPSSTSTSPTTTTSTSPTTTSPNSNNTSSGSKGSPGSPGSKGSPSSPGSKGSDSANSPKENGEVFNIAENVYTYEDAKGVCGAYNAKLATYDQIEQAYDKGGEWCNYGWSEGQMIFYPTQKSTWDDLQNSEDTKLNCGRPGINGGYVDDPNLEFGVNCFGKKPSMSLAEQNRMKANADTMKPTKKPDQALDAVTNKWRDKIDKIQLNSFSHDKWSYY